MRKWIRRINSPDPKNHLYDLHQPFSRIINKVFKVKNAIVFTFILLGFGQVCWGQDAIGDFQSRQTGSFKSNTTWQKYTGTAGGWVNTTSIPGGGNKVTIRTGHTITITNSPTISNLIIDSGGILTYSAGFAFSITSNLTINGKVIVIPGAVLNITGNTNLGSLECLLLKTDNSDTGSLISGSFSGTGTIRVERFMSNSDNWHLFSSPVFQSYQNFILGNPEIPDLFSDPAIDNTYIGVGMRDYNTASDSWNSYFNYRTNTPAGNVGNGKGFSIRTYNDAEGTGFIYATGVPNSVSSGFSIPLTITGKNWNCIGNPFTSGLSVSQFLSANSSSLDPSFVGTYLWDSANGVYIVYNSSSNSNIQLGQGFFVKAISTGGIIKFSSDMQVDEPSLIFKAAETSWPSINIVAQSQTSSSSTQFKFITNTTKGLDRGYDAGMLKANPDFALYSKLLVDNAVDFTIQCLPDQNYDQYVIPIGIDCKVAGDVTFTAQTVNLPSGCQALLEDRLTKRFTRLDLKDAKYTASMSADTKGTGRFYLHTSDVISGDITLENQPFKVYETGKTVYINGEVSEKAKFFVYSSNGKLMDNFSAKSQVQNQFSVSGFPAGVYILTVDDQNQKKSVKFLIEN